MKIGIVGSMQFVEKMLVVKKKLEKLGHKPFLTDLHKGFEGKNDKEKEKLKLFQKFNKDAIREFWRAMQGLDAIIVLNYDKNGIKNYVGGNTFLEMGFAHVLNQKIFLLNSIPDMLYTSEIVAMKPIILNGDLSKIE